MGHPAVSVLGPMKFVHPTRPRETKTRTDGAPEGFGREKGREVTGGPPAPMKRNGTSDPTRDDETGKNGAPALERICESIAGMNRG
jgi:hypothetical protein